MEIWYPYLKSPGNQGFILLPRRLMEMSFKGFNRVRPTDYAAYVYLLMKACYKDHPGPNRLKRGEVRFSVRGLADELGWSQSKLSRFLNFLKNNGVIKVRTTAKGSVMHLLCYECMCYRAKEKAQEAAKERMSAEEMARFEEFWQEYNVMTAQAFVDKAETLRVWCSLPEEEQCKAYEGIREYVLRLPSLSRARTPLNYLQKRSFLMDDYVPRRY